MKVKASNPRLNGRAPHLLCKNGDIGEIVLLPGDPARIDYFSNILKDFKIISENREYRLATGIYKDIKISICSTGIGAPSTEIAVLELIEVGAKALIRIGGTGALRSDIKCGDLIISTASMRASGTSEFYAPKAYPAIASYEVVESLIEACEENNVKYFKGITASVPSFFAGQGRPALSRNFHDENLINTYANMNILNMEMESETILTLSNIFNVYSGCICASHCNRITDEWCTDFEDFQVKMIKIALEASVKLYKKYLRK